MMGECEVRGGEGEARSEEAKGKERSLMYSTRYPMQYKYRDT